VATNTDERKPGQFADERFRERKRAWLKRIWWILPLVAAFEVAVFASLGWLFYRDHMPFFWGTGLGVGLSVMYWFADSPPHHIERWRQGAQGEKQTAKQLRPLLRDGWVLLNDVESRYGNIDHILVGPAGVFVLETKNLNGVCAVGEGILSVRWREDPTDGYENHSIAPRARAAAAEVAEQLRGQGLRQWVQPVVVLWSSFEQTSFKSGKVAWISGKELRASLLKQQPRLTAAEVAKVAGALRRSTAGGGVVREPVPAVVS
jgi:hypothetical protein